MSRSGRSNGGNGRGGAKPVPPAPAALSTLSEEMALAIAHANAGSTYELVAARAAADTDRLPAGRWWYSGGMPPGNGNGRGDVQAHVQLLARFVDQHADGVPGEAVYLYSAGVLKHARKAWAELPLAQRMAFEIFARLLPALLAEAREDAKRRAHGQTAPPAAPLPDYGVGRRSLRQAQPFAARVVMTRKMEGG